MVLFYRKVTFFTHFRNIFPGGKQKDFRYFTYILHSAFPDAICRRLPGQLFHGSRTVLGRKQEHTTAGVYLHMTAHITQLKILHGVSLLCFCLFRAFPVNTVSHNSDTIKRTFKGFLRTFCRKKQTYAPQSAHAVHGHFLGDSGLGSPRSAAFPQETSTGAAVFRHDPLL